MHILKRILLLCFMGAGVQALRSQPAALPPDNAGKDSGGAQAGQKAPDAKSDSAVVSSGTPAAPMDSQSEQKARDLLRNLTATPAPPKVGAAPPEVNDRDAAREKALSEVRKINQSSAPAPVPSRAQLDSDREKEISRIESEVEASRKRRAQPGTTIQGSSTNKTLIGGVLASPASPTLTPQAEKKARELLHQETIVLYSDNPAPQPVAHPERSTLPVFNQKPAAKPAAAVTTAASTAKAASAAAPQAVSAAPDAAPTNALTGTDEEKARELLRKTLEQSPAAANAKDSASGRSRVLPPAAPSTLDLPPAPAGTPPVVQTPPPTQSPAAPAATIVPAPAPAPETVATAAKSPSAPSLPSDQEVAARKLLEQSYSAVPSAPAPGAAEGKSFTVTPVPAPVPVPVPSTAAASVTPPPAPVAITPEQEAKARELLYQQSADLTRPVVPVATPAPSIVTTAPTATTPSPATTPATPNTATLSAEQEAAARELVLQQIANLGAAPTPVPAPATTVAPTPAPAPVPEPIPAAPTPPLVVSPAVSAVAPVPPVPTAAPLAPEPSIPAAGTLTADQEAKARAALEQAEKQLASIPSTTQNAPHVDSAAELKAKRELIKQQEREGKKRRAAEKKIEEAAAKKRVEQDAKLKKEMDRLNREEEAKAKAEARRQLEAEANARKQEARVRNSSAKPAAPAPAVTENARPVETAPPVVTKAAPVAETRSTTSSTPAGAGKTKQQRLDDLTQSYVQDKISAQDYYRERTKILSEPGE